MVNQYLNYVFRANVFFLRGIFFFCELAQVICSFFQLKSSRRNQKFHTVKKRMTLYQKLIGNKLIAVN